MYSHLILECPFWSKCNETGLNYCSIIMNRFYHGRTNQKRSLIKIVSAETQRAHSPCPKDLTIRIGRDRLGGREKGAEWTLNYNSFLWLVWRGRQEEAKRGRAQEKCGAAEQGGRSRLRSFPALGAFAELSALPPASLGKGRESAPNSSPTGTLLWVEQAQLNPCSHSSKPRPPSVRREAYFSK